MYEDYSDSEHIDIVPEQKKNITKPVQKKEKEDQVDKNNGKGKKRETLGI